MFHNADFSPLCTWAVLQQRLPSDSVSLLTALGTSQTALQPQPPDSENEEPVGTLMSLNAHFETGRLGPGEKRKYTKPRKVKCKQNPHTKKKGKKENGKRREEKRKEDQRKKRTKGQEGKKGQG